MPSIPESQGQLSWRVARQCNGGACIRVAADDDGVIIGNSQPDGPVILYSRAEWTAFVEGIRQGDFDDLF
jgi:hypothetical protein